ncbi:MAG: class I SAM-dependent methyltransferase [Bradymonadaceae bacterium]
MNDDDLIKENRSMLASRLKKNLRRVGNAARRMNVTCYRIYDADIPEIPLYIDWYEGKVHVSVMARRRHDDRDEEAWVDAMLEILVEVLEVDPEDVFVKTRQRQKGTWQYGKFAQEKTEFLVHEGGLEFIVNLSDYLDTGLFLDHRVTREMVREEVKGKHFLNLFAYTGAFSVYAADGGAASTTTIDMSNTYLNRARRNMAQNGFTNHHQHRFVRADLLVWLEESERRKDKYDLVVLDPPTYSKSKKMERDFDIQRDHVWVLDHVKTTVRKGGVIYFSTNFRTFKFDEDALEFGRIEEITERTIPQDFRHSSPHRCWRIEV